MHVTLNQLKKWQACADGYKKVINSVGLDHDKDAPINLSSILKSNDMNDVFWCIENMELTPDQERDFRLLACGYAEQVLLVFEKERPEDNRPRECIDMARRYAIGEATQEEMASARASARASSWASSGASARASARAASWASSGASSGASARASSWASSGDAEKITQTEMLMELLLRHEK